MFSLTGLVAMTLFAFVAMAGEALVGRLQGRRLYRLDALLSDLGCSTGNLVGIGAFGLTGTLGYEAILGLVPWRIADVSEPLHWVLALLGLDFVMWLRHVMSHRIALLWAVHQVHHQAHTMNLGSAQRSPWLQALQALPTCWLLAAMGLPMEFVAVNFALTLGWQLVVHTEVVDRLGVLDHVLVTPMVHRVHHACNPQYLDTNYGGILAIWDKLFGTWVEQTEAPVYGLVHGLDTLDPLEANLSPWLALWAKARTAPTFLNSLETLLRPPGWDPVSRTEHVSTEILADRAVPRASASSLTGRVLAFLTLLAMVHLVATTTALSAPVHIAIGLLCWVALSGVSRIGRPLAFGAPMPSLRPAALLLTAGIISGCKVVDAPEDLEDLAVFAFTTFDAEEQELPEAAVAGLHTELDANAEQLELGYRITELTEADLGEVGLDATIDLGITGMAATATYGSDLDGIASAWSHPRMEEVMEGTLAFEILEEHGDRACFLSRACESWGIDVARTNDVGIFGTSEQVVTRELRWVWSEDLGTELLTARDLAPDPAEMSSAFISVDQQYSYSLFLPEGDGTLRFDAFWVDASVVQLELPDSFALDQGVSMMAKTAEQVDAWVDAQAD